MNRFLAVLSVAGGSLLVGCSTVVGTVDPVPCPVTPEDLAQTCASPASLPADASYRALIQAGLDDRSALKSCAVHDKFLADALRACNASIAAYTAKLHEAGEKVNARQ